MTQSFTFPTRLTTDATELPQSGKLIGEIQTRLIRLGFKIDRSDLARKELGQSTRDAIAAFTSAQGLTARTARPVALVGALDTAFTDSYLRNSKKRTRVLQDLLSDADTGAIDPAERSAGRFGPTTETAWRKFQEAAGETPDGHVTQKAFEALRERATAGRLAEKPGVRKLHKALIDALRIAKLSDHRIAADELKQGVVGPSTKAAIQAFQKKYSIPGNGTPDALTLERIVTVVASIGNPQKLLKARTADELAPVKRTVRLNMTGAGMAPVHAALAYFGYDIAAAEAGTGTFGKTTQAAIRRYQRARGLEVSGHVDNPTRKRMNAEISKLKPGSEIGALRPRVRGSVRGEDWNGMAGAKLRLWHLRAGKDPVKLAEKPAGPNGFFDVPYDAPRDPDSGKSLAPFHLLVEATTPAGDPVGKATLFDPRPIAWANFTQGDLHYRGPSVFETLSKALRDAAGTAIANLRETDDDAQISRTAQAAGMAPEQAMRLVLAHLAAAEIGDARITPAVVFALLGLGQPTGLPSDLLAGTDGWDLIDQLVLATANGIVFAEPAVIADSFALAAQANLMPISDQRRTAEIAAALDTRRADRIRNEPLLPGNAALEMLMDVAGLSELARQAVAALFLEHGAFEAEFWTAAQDDVATIGGQATLDRFRAVVDLGDVARNFRPMIEALLAIVDDNGNPLLTKASDTGKLTRADWDQIVTALGQVPANTDGDAPADRRATYWLTLFNNARRVFPESALFAALESAPNSGLNRVGDVAALFDKSASVTLAQGNLELAFKREGIAVEPEVMDEARVIQRVHRIAPEATVATMLFENRIHDSAKVVSLGKERFVAMLTANPEVQPGTAKTIYARAEWQYANMLQRLAEYHPGLQRFWPNAMPSPKITKADLPAEAAGLANLELLFGSLDYCTCNHCQGVYGPAAYFADILRYVGEQRATAPNRSVLDELIGAAGGPAGRRPDLKHIKLNCDNTETVLPYIDLVLEVLEAHVDAPNPAPDFDHQTTWEPAALRASQEHQRTAAYERLLELRFPMYESLDLWNAEVRAFLGHLGVSRPELIETIQRPLPQDAALPAAAGLNHAAELFGLAPHETALIVAANHATQAIQRDIWGFAANPPADLPVLDFLRRSGLDYDGLLQLIAQPWPSVGAGNALGIDRPDGICDLTKQRVVNLSVARYDRLHRMLRLHHKTGLPLYDLDRMIRHPGLGANALNAATLRAFATARQVMTRLKLGIDDILLFLGPLDTQAPVDLKHPVKPQLSAYEKLFLNPERTPTLDPAFQLAALGSDSLGDHAATLSSALGLSIDDIALLAATLADDTMTLATISVLARHATLSRALKMRVEDILELAATTGIGDPFANIGTLRRFIAHADAVRESRFDVATLSYLITPDETAPLALREEAIADRLHLLRDALVGTVDGNLAEAVVDWSASMFGLPADAARVLIDTLQIAGQSFADLLQDPALTATNPDGSFSNEVTQAALPDFFTAAVRLHRVALYAKRFDLDRVELVWLATGAGAGALMRPQDAATGGAPAASFDRWLNLAKWKAFARAYPAPEETSLPEIFDLAAEAGTAEAAIHTAIAQLTQWPADVVTALAAELGLAHGASSDYTRPEAYARMAALRGLVRRLGVEIDTAGALTARDAADEPGKSAALAQAMRSKYDEATWLEKRADLEDGLREAKRDALLAYLVARSQRDENPQIAIGGQDFRNPAYWRDADDALAYLLIDVEMSSCQLTSRLKQAISSVQMYVQRCLLGLERPFVEIGQDELADTVSDNSWRQWEWMKTYRIWEANRKIFLYPENWIEPELRDDKSPFFKEFEQDIQQSELTEETAENALRRYLEKVEEVAALEVTGIFHELENSDPTAGQPPDINFVHVVGRTREQPHRYFYRAFDQNLVEWSPWERIDAEIEGDQAVPVVYNRKLHLFWLTAEEKPVKQPKTPPAQGSDHPTDTPEPYTQLELRLAWSTRTKDGWTAKRQSAQKLIHPWPRPRFAYTIKPRYRAPLNELWVDLFITQTPEFNSGRFWNSFTNQPDFLTLRHPYTAGAWPWHSSSFVFDGSVKDVRLKPLTGAYRLFLAEEGSQYVLRQTDSHTFLQKNFGDAGRAVRALDGPGMVAPRLPVPQGMNYRNGRLANIARGAASGPVNVLENRVTHMLLGKGIGPYELVGSLHRASFDSARFGPVPFVYQDPKRAFFIRPRWRQRQVGYNAYIQTYQYDFYPFYHPYASLFLRELNRDGLRGLLTRRLQMVPQLYAPGNAYGFGQYQPAARSVPSSEAVNDRLDFTREGAYALYNWETFVHAPFTLACRLSENQRFDEAMRMFHTIFDPTNVGAGPVPQRYWVSKPFYQMGDDAYRQQRIEVLLENIEQNVGELRAWKNDPFKPYVIARFRPVALQKAIVMKYLDNIIAWADQLFRRDSIESINQATTLYLLASEILGRRPDEVPHVDRAEKSFAELTADGGLDPFGNAKVEALLENLGGPEGPVITTDPGAESMPQLSTFYFCIPNNDRLGQYWTTIADRLWKIRHCQNIEGVFRQLALFEPPIDPALLVKAAAAGLDLSTIAAPSTAALGPYRFRTLVAAAERFVAALNGLSSSLLQALERRDAEELSVLRAKHETVLRDTMRDLRRLAIDEAGQQVKVLEKQRDAANDRKEFYENRAFINGWEGTALGLNSASALAEVAIAVGYTLAGGLSVIPAFVLGASGFGGSPHATVKTPEGLNLAAAAENAVATLQSYSRASDKLASLASTMGRYSRRQEDWDHNAKQAGYDADRLTLEITAAQIREDMAREERRILDLEREQAAQAEEFLKTKYTNAQLFDWMVAQTSTTYFQAYQLAFDLAKAAEAAMQHELCDPAASFIQFGHWDSLRKGLLSGDRLGQDLRRLEAHYLSANRRTLELQKHVSLAEVAPEKLLALKFSGTCTFTLPEWLFDMDYPGHYRRNLKAVSVTVPAVVGPYSNVNATLTLIRNSIRVSTDVAGGYGDALNAGGDARFLSQPVAQSSIATSHGRNDAGMFVFDFADERFLPFEGAGAVSEWTLELPAANNRFDLSTVSDVVLHLHYSAERAPVAALADAARANIEANLPSAGVQLLDLKSSFGTAWRRFFVPADADDQELLLDITDAHLPFFLVRRGDLEVAGLDLILDTGLAENFDIEVTPPGLAASDELAAPEADFDNRPAMAKADFAPGTAVLGTWRFRIKRSAAGDFRSLTEDQLANAQLIFGLRLS